MIEIVFGSTAAASSDTWTRPSDWLALPSIVSADQKFVGLHAIHADSNFLALSAAGDYTVDWGDGTTENYASGVVAYRTYDYATFDVGNATLTTLGYKQAIVTVTPQSGQNLTTLNLHQKHNQTNLNAYTSGFIDIAVAGTLMTSLLIGVATAGVSTQTINFRDLERINILSTAITSASYLLSACSSLASVTADTATVSNFTFMFSGCSSLLTIPLLNTAAGTTFTSMFSGCSSLQTIPLLNTAAGTLFGSMFATCSSLQTIPLINTALGTVFTSMFTSCFSLQTIPLLNTAAGTAFGTMFNACSSLQAIPLLSLTAGTVFTSMFASCSSLQTGAVSDPKYALSYASCKLSDTALASIISNLGTANTALLAFTISTNWGAVTPVSLSGSTVAGSVTVAMASTTGITTGMQVTGVGTPSTQAVSVTFTDVGNTVNKTAHGLSNTDEVSFANVSTTTGIVTYKIYFVVGATANTFQVALTSGGAAIDLVTNGTGTILYKATVTAIAANVSVTLSLPASSTGTNTLSFRNLKTNTALLKGWAVTG